MSVDQRTCWPSGSKAISAKSPDAITIPESPTAMAACAENSGTAMLAEIVADAGSITSTRSSRRPTRSRPRPSNASAAACG